MNGGGYSSELYDAIAAFGLRRDAAILDIGCGDGIAAQPFADNNFPVTGVDPSREMLAAAGGRLPGAVLVEGTAEALPFPEQRFDVVLAAQSVHLFDRVRALLEIGRVVKSGGIVAIWWKQLMAQEGIRELREQVFRDRHIKPPAEGLLGGFKEFYACEELREQTLRVLPWRTSLPLAQFVQAEPPEIREALERRIRERLGAHTSTLDLAYVQYLYLAKKP